jgi:hypothetical protein
MRPVILDVKYMAQVDRILSFGAYCGAGPLLLDTGEMLPVPGRHRECLVEGFFKVRVTPLFLVATRAQVQCVPIPVVYSARRIRSIRDTMIETLMGRTVAKGRYAVLLDQLNDLIAIVIHALFVFALLNREKTVPNNFSEPDGWDSSCRDTNSDGEWREALDDGKYLVKYNHHGDPIYGNPNAHANDAPERLGSMNDGRLVFVAWTLFVLLPLAELCECVVCTVCGPHSFSCEDRPICPRRQCYF